MKQAPMLRILLPFVAGIVLAEYLSPSPILCGCVMAAALAAMAVSAFSRLPIVKSQWFFATALCLVLASVGVLRLELQETTPPSHFTHLTANGHDTTLRLKLTNYPIEKAHTYSVEAEVLGVVTDSVTTPTSGTILLNIAKDENAGLLKYGDLLVAKCRPKEPSDVSNPYQFDYKRYLHRKGILRQCYLNDNSYHITGNDSKGIMAWCKRVQHRWVSLLQHSDLSPKQQGIAEALLLGWKADLEESTQQQFRNAGITHLLCVSGLHVGLVAQIIGFCLFFLSRRRKPLAKIIQLAGIWFFVFISGMAPATLRAGIMFSLFVVRDLIGRNTSSVNILATSAVVMLVANPCLLFDTGWQLSHLAVLSIILLYNPIRKLIPFDNLVHDSHRHKTARWALKPIEKIWNLAVLSTAAQIGTLPVTLYCFHQFPTYFLIANVTIIPFAGIMLITIALTIALHGCGLLFSWCTSILSFELKCTDRITQWVSTLPHAVIDNIYFDGTMVILSFAAIIFATLLLRQRKTIYLPVSLAFLFALSCYRWSVLSQANQQKAWIIYADSHTTAIEIFVGRQSILLGDSTLCMNPESLDYTSKNLRIHRCINQPLTLPYSRSVSTYGVTIEQQQADIFGTTITIADRSTEERIKHANQPTNTLKTNYLLLSGCDIPISRLTQFFCPDTIVIAANNAPWTINQWENECQQYHIPCYNLRIHGALTHDLQTEKD